MGRILVPPDKLMEVADQFLHGKHEMDRMLNFLSGRIDFVQQGWSGATRERFFQEFQVSRQSMSVTLERLSTVAQELIFISNNFTQVDGEKVVLDVPGNGVPIKTASSGEGWLHKIFEQIGKAEITKAEAQLEASKLQGEIFWDTAQGAKGAIQEDLTLGILPDKERDYDHPMAAKVGEILGHVATTLQGAGEVVAGLGGEGLSVAVSSTGVGSIVGVPGLIGSAALAAHGSTTAFKGASGIGKSSVELWQMVKGEGGGSSKQTLTSNKGTSIDVTPSSNHTSTTTNPHPAKGEPNSSVDILDKNTGEIKTRRYYDENGRAVRDVDYTNHGNSKQHPEWPHEHIFEWKEDGTFKRVNKK
ncbi:WXG100 family type VII secretion target [Paenibacillus polymyxa]|uniref:WXG100 family type VII secretion target n=2 Tax=Paenibacillus TaxID=44249 RepID=UPI00031DF618|nr:MULTISPECIES: WXG100 family type VII secretion target [Paenibacillus]MCJ1218763.1 WXG100 family type VII secretion target [Paenibacillus polymyxa]MDU8675257.1 WXG100 family type VII secretion target [Paenibacillus polymyxa]MDU8700164.1 WXG100 family type VII secretion target [Paenibacillus polymyxa]URJ54784.1 WXG100 family type VII secretion target [Paenibacillus polymyxa]URJ66628.1 WXG100 family type VII secretion target [Paenibacillus polymyxa]